MVVGVSALIVIMGVMNGLQNDLREKILIGSPDIRVLNIRLRHGAQGLAAGAREGAARAGRRGGRAVRADARRSSSAGHKYSDGAYVMGILPEGEGGPPVTTIRQYATAGDFRFVTLGRQAARRGARRAAGEPAAACIPGVDSITLTTDRQRGRVRSPARRSRARSARGDGIFDTGMYEYDNAYVFVVACRWRRSWPARRRRDRARGAHDQDRWTRAGDGASGSRRRSAIPYRTEDWQAQNSSLFQALKLEKLGMTFILLLIVLVAAFNIVGTLTMVVADKTQGDRDPAGDGDAGGVDPADLPRCRGS